MKRLPYKDHIRFAKEALALFIKLGFQPYPADAPGHDYRERSLRIMTDLGVYMVHKPDAEVNCGDFSHDITGRFEVTPDKGDYTSDLYKRFRSLDANYSSGKWNLMGSAKIDETLAAFELRMGWVNARPFTPEEQAQLAIDDAAFAVKLAADRADWKAYAKEEKAREEANQPADA